MPAFKLFALALLAASPLLAQSTDPVVHNAADLQQRVAKLTETAKAAPTGFASATIDDYGNDYTMIVVRVHTGDAERHQFWADQFVVSKGTLALVTGGTMLDEHANKNATRTGETLGSGLQGGKEVVLHAGEIAHVPAGVPHWVKVAPGTTTTYLVFKEK
jgi:mannose-6-phosphate isomerase-like protein (cupin superfamily)